MARADEFSTGAKSPVKKYLEWDSAERGFKYYDKESAKNVYVKAPLSFISLKEMATIRGFHEPSQSGIYSNELPLQEFGTKELVVKTFKGNVLAKGIYKDIKATLASSGAKFGMAVYALLGEDLVCITLKGSSFSAWYDFVADNRKSFLTNSIDILTVEDKKKGATKYTQPVFTLGKEISKADGDKAEVVYEELITYIKSRATQAEAPQAVHAEEVPAPAFGAAPDLGQDLPF